jgi:hypothetical protein
LGEAGAADAVTRARVNTAAAEITESYPRTVISAACDANSAYTVMTGDWEDRIAESASSLGVRDVALRQLALAFHRDQVSGDVVLGAAIEQVCQNAGNG